MTVENVFMMDVTDAFEITCNCKRGIPLTMDGLSDELKKDTCMYRSQIYLRGEPTCLQKAEDMSKCKPGTYSCLIILQKVNVLHLLRITF